MKGRIDHQEVVVLIDCGEMYNFIPQRLVEKLNLPLTKAAN